MQKTLIILFAIMGVCHINAQTISTSQLIGTKWKNITSTDVCEEVCEFSKDSITTELRYVENNKVVKFKEAYYVSPSIPAEFDNSEVGKNITGAYIVMYNNFDGMDYYKFKKLDKGKGIMILHLPYRDDVVGGMRNTDFTYKRIK